MQYQEKPQLPDNSADKMLRKWQPIETVPTNAEVELSFYDNGQHHALAFPCRRDGSGWSHVQTGRIIDVRPTHWRLWDHTGVTSRDL